MEFLDSAPCISDCRSSPHGSARGNILPFHGAVEGAIRRNVICAVCFCLSLLLLSPAYAAKRVAFVVGIDAYDNLTEPQQLKKAVNDARAIGEALAGLGYDVQKADNVGRTDSCGLQPI